VVEENASMRTKDSNKTFDRVVRMISQIGTRNSEFADPCNLQALFFHAARTMDRKGAQLERSRYESHWIAPLQTWRENTRRQCHWQSPFCILATLACKVSEKEFRGLTFNALPFLISVLNPIEVHGIYHCFADLQDITQALELHQCVNLGVISLKPNP
jgi:hypothetical protein